MELTYKAVIALAGIAVVGGYYLEQKAKAEIAAVVNDINPLNRKNEIYTGTDKAIADITGQKHFDLGHALFCFFHSSEPICNPTPANTGTSVSQYLSGLLGVHVCP